MQINFWELIKDLLPLWPLWLILLVLVGIRPFFYWLGLEVNNWHIRRNFRKGEKKRSDIDLLQWLRGMEPSEFENYIADLFSRLGYNAKAVGGPRDGGIDVVIEKEGVKHYIQCKKFITSQVTVGDVRDFYGALVDHFADGKGYFITTNTFTLDAEKFVEDKPIELVDGDKLIRYIKMAKKDKDELIV